VETGFASENAKYGTTLDMLSVQLHVAQRELHRNDRATYHQSALQLSATPNAHESKRGAADAVILVAGRLDVVSAQALSPTELDQLNADQKKTPAAGCCRRWRGW
jgi:hypothetical protein